MVRLSRLTLLVLSGTALACRTERAVPPPADPPAAAAPVAGTPTTLPSVETALFAPLPVAMVTQGQMRTAPQVALGRALYYERVLSAGHTMSCNSCHPLNAWGADGRALSIGHDGKPGTRNAPTVYQAAGHLAQFWDGRATTVEQQAFGPMLNPVEMGMPDSAAILKALRTSATYIASFRDAFPGDDQPITYTNIGLALGAFERGLLTPGRWDRYVTGDTLALTSDERAGFRTFRATGCASCHAGAYLGGDRYAKAGLVVPWFTSRDSGRFVVTHQPSDLFVFKVPSLRNIAKTGPYFHDGSVATLQEAVRLMAHHQLGKTLSVSDAQSIVTWMGALTGEAPARYIAFPQHPR